MYKTKTKSEDVFRKLSYHSLMSSYLSPLLRIHITHTHLKKKHTYTLHNYTFSCHILIIKTRHCIMKIGPD